MQGRSLLLRWSAWFYVGQVAIGWLIGSIYFLAIPGFSIFEPQGLMIVIGYLGHIALLAISPIFIIFPLILFFPYRRLIFLLAALLAVVISSYLFIDTIVYYLYQYHFNSTVLSLTFYGITKGIFGLSLLEKMIPIMIIGVILALELFYARSLWRLLESSTSPQKSLLWLIGMLIALIYAAYIGVAVHMKPVHLRAYVEKTTFLPLYAHSLRFIMPKEKEALAWVHDSQNLFLTVQYPRNPLQYQQPAQWMNLVIIGIDSWRFDMLNQEVTPHMFELAKQSWTFKNHFSGGNATGPGIFSLFYGLPANYMSAMERQHRGPILLSELMKLHYQMGIFSSAPLYMPPVDRSVFVEIPSLDREQQPADSVIERDQLVVKKFADFIRNRDVHQPVFSFLFFDAAHSYCGTDDIPGPFAPVAARCNRAAFNKKTDYLLYLNRYKNALLSVDAQVNQVIATLRENNLLDQTVILIVGDHGEEFDDSGHGYYGHASNFTHYQTQTPLVVYWPGEKPQEFSHKTSHFDIVPTLMKKLLGCLNSSKDYSIGEDLLSQQLRPYLIVTSYVDFGIVEPERVTRIYSAGNFRVETNDAQPVLASQTNTAVLRKAFEAMRVFYRE